MPAALVPRIAPRVIIVGGGAGGLELAVRLGHRLGRPGRARITLIDAQRRHLWKPLLHQVAAGTLDADLAAFDYLQLAARHDFDWQQGALAGLERGRRRLWLSPLLGQDGRELLPRRWLDYDLLVLALGSQGHDFGIPGVGAHAIALDTPAEAAALQRRLFELLLAGRGAAPGPQLLVIGGGATGVELAAELREAGHMLEGYGLSAALRITVVEAGARLLPQLPTRLSLAAAAQLQRLDIAVELGRAVVEVAADRVQLTDGSALAADLVVWAAGIRAPALLRDLDGLACNARNQLEVGPTLQTTLDPAVFALGDCAACVCGGDAVPARAQAARQQARFLAAQIPRLLERRPLRRFVYRDRGALVGLGRRRAIGALMGGPWRHTLFVAGRVAELMFVMLRGSHQRLLLGWRRALLLGLSGRVSSRPRVKLH